MVTRRDAARSPRRLAVADAEPLLRGASAGLPPLSLASGADDYLRERVVAAFRAGAEAEGADFQRVEGDELEAAVLAEALQSISLFAASRRIWIREAAKLDKACEEALLAWADGAADGVRVLVTTARDVEELRTLQAIAARGLSISCEARPGDVTRWAERLVGESGLKLPAGAAGAIAAGAGNLLAMSQEVAKLRALADAAGVVPASALAALRGARGGGSLDRWADAVLSGDGGSARREAAALDAEGVAGTSALWAVAERALAALEPQAFAYRRGAPSSIRLTTAAARGALDAVYAADRGLKRGEIRDAEIRDVIELRLLRSRGTYRA
jgi:DNA polymerase III delta subunit